MQTIAAGKFKIHCLSLLRDVFQKHDTLIITKHGKPIAQVSPILTSRTEQKNLLKDSISFEKDIV